MNLRTGIRVLTAVTASAALTIGSALSATADSSWILKNANGTTLGWGYFHSYGEKIGVYDNYKDGHSVVVQWRADSMPIGQWRHCWDSNGAANGPEECDEAIDEGVRVVWRVCTAERSTGEKLRCSGYLTDYA